MEGVMLVVTMRFAIPDGEFEWTYVSLAAAPAVRTVNKVASKAV